MTPAAIGFLALVCLVPFNFMPKALVPIAGHAVPVGWIVLFPIGAALLVSSAWTFARERRVPALVAWTSALTASLLASCFVAEFRGMAFSTTAGFLLRSVALAWAGFLIGRDEEARERFVRWLPVLGAVVAAAALYEPLTKHYFLFERSIRPDQPRQELWDPMTGIAVGAVGQPLPFSAVLNLILPFALWFWLRRRTILSALAPALVGLAIFMTFRRTAYVTAFCITGVMLASAGRRLLRPALAGLLVAGLLAMAVPSVRRHLVARFNPLTTIEELAGGHRVLVYGVTWDIVRQYPILGIGTRQYERQASRFALYFGAINTQDSQYLRMAAENGLVGFAILIGFLRWLVRTLWRARAGEGLPFLVSCCAFLAALFVLDGFYWPAPSMVFFAVTGVGCGRAQAVKIANKR